MILIIATKCGRSIPYLLEFAIPLPSLKTDNK